MEIQVPMENVVTDVVAEFVGTNPQYSSMTVAQNVYTLIIHISGMSEDDWEDVENVYLCGDGRSTSYGKLLGTFNATKSTCTFSLQMVTMKCDGIPYLEHVLFVDEDGDALYRSGQFTVICTQRTGNSIYY